MESTRPARAVAPLGISHIVLIVRDLEESHPYYTEVLGFRQTGEWRPRSEPKRCMRFHSGSHNGRTNHHDLALAQMPGLPDHGPWKMDTSPNAVNHIAVRLPDREAWLARLAFLRVWGMAFRSRVNLGVAHGVYLSDPNGYGVEVLHELAPEVWQGDVNKAPNSVERLPTEGEAALAARMGNPVFRKS